MKTGESEIPKIIIVSNYVKSFHSDRPEVYGLFELQKNNQISLEVIGAISDEYRSLFEEIGVTYYEHPIEKKFSLKTTRFIRSIIRKEKPDIIYSMSNKGITNVNFAAINLPVKVVTFRGAGKIYWTDPTFYLTHLNRRVDAIICVSKSVEKVVKKQTWLFKPETYVVYPAQDVEWFSDPEPLDRSDWGIAEEALVLGCVANYRKTKGFEYLIEATKELPLDLPIYFFFVGKDTDSDCLKSLVQGSPYANNFFLLGYREDIASLNTLFDATVLPSTKIEGLGKTIMEAMASGKPSLVTDTGGPTELIQHLEQGIVVPPKDEKALARAILKLYKDSDLRKLMGKSAKEKLIKVFSIKNSKNQYMKAFQGILMDK